MKKILFLILLSAGVALMSLQSYAVIDPPPEKEKRVKGYDDKDGVRICAGWGEKTCIVFEDVL